MLAELARCRDEIERIDAEIVALLGRRLAIGKRTGALKRAADLPILDPAQEEAVISRIAAAARQAGLPADSMRELFWHIVGMSRRMQEEQREAPDDR